MSTNSSGNGVSRRACLQGTGGVAAAAAVAGCGGQRDAGAGTDTEGTGSGEPNPDATLNLVTSTITTLDPDSRTAILVAGSVRRRDARMLARTATRTGRMYTHVRTLDGTHVGSFEHASPEKFFPTTARASPSDRED